MLKITDAEFNKLALLIMGIDETSTDDEIMQAISTLSSREMAHFGSLLEHTGYIKGDKYRKACREMMQ